MSDSALSSSQLISLDFLPGERPAVRSVDIARHFGVRHKHVLRDIEDLRRKLPDSFTGTNFGLSDYQDSTGRSLPCYLLTRDAFTLLVMGWQSARALAWKLRYIEAFNALERAALENARLEGVRSAAHALASITAGQRAIMRRAMRYQTMGLSKRETAKLLDVHHETVRRALVAAKRLGLGAGA